MKLCGVKFCGGCNPRYDRGKAYEEIRSALRHRLDFQLASETDDDGLPTEYDLLLVLGGCGSCCASVEQYQVKGPMVRLWEAERVGECVQLLEACSSE